MTERGTLVAGKPLSYTQNLEDWHLWLALGSEGPGVYIDVGAGHPIADNVSMWFYERGWRGVIVEPQSALCQLYPALRRRDAVFEGLLGRISGTADLHVFRACTGSPQRLRLMLSVPKCTATVFGRCRFRCSPWLIYARDTKSTASTF